MRSSLLCFRQIPLIVLLSQAKDPVYLLLVVKVSE